MPGPYSGTNLISILVTDYTQKRRGQALLFAFEYNLLPKSNFNHYMDRAKGPTWLPTNLGTEVLGYCDFLFNSFTIVFFGLKLGKNNSSREISKYITRINQIFQKFSERSH